MKRLFLVMLSAVMLSIPILSNAADFSYARYASLLDDHVKAGAVINGITVASVDYQALYADSRKPDSDYSLLLADLATFSPASLSSREEKMAFWINVYNIAAIKTIIDHYPVDSIRSRKINWLGLPWSRKAITIGGREYALEEIEFGELVEGFRDLRIHFGINCASVSCVDLRREPYRAGTLNEDLEDQGRRFLADSKKGMRIDIQENKIYLSQAFKFDKKHFDEYAGGALPFVAPYVLEQDREAIRTGTLKLEYLDYDWKANDVKNVH